MPYAAAQQQVTRWAGWLADVEVRVIVLLRRVIGVARAAVGVNV